MRAATTLGSDGTGASVVTSAKASSASDASGLHFSIQPDTTSALAVLSSHGTPQRDGDRIFLLIRQKANIHGLVLLHDPRRVADRLDIVALEHAATVLALEFAHQRVLAETELRLRCDLVEDLLAGTDDDRWSRR